MINLLLGDFIIHLSFYKFIFYDIKVNLLLSKLIQMFFMEWKLTVLQFFNLHLLKFLTFLDDLDWIYLN